MSAVFLPVTLLTAAIHIAVAAPWVDPDTRSVRPAARDARVPDRFGSSDIRDWYAPDDDTIVISTYSHGRFKGRFMNHCRGVRFADSVGFSTMGPYELDSSTRILLPDGTRCALRNLVPYSDEEEKRDREARKKKVKKRM